MNPILMAMDNHFLTSAILSWMGQALLFGTALAGLTWLLIRMTGCRIRPSLEAALWSIVLVKFLVPAGPFWSLSLAGLCGSLALPADTPAPWHPVEISSNALAGAQTIEEPKKALPATPLFPDPWPWSTIAGMVYLACVLALLSRRIGYHAKLLSRCRALPLAGPEISRVAAEVCKRLGMRRIPSIRVGQGSPTSYIIGVFRPLLVLSPRQLLRPEELETVVLHEVAHLRRGDMLVRFLQWIAGSLLFFWPVVAWVNRRIDSAREYACDEWALCQGKLAAVEYARCLLNAVQPMANRRVACHPTSLAAYPNKMERRIDMILNFSDHSSKRNHWNLLTLALLLIWGGFALSGAVSAGENAPGQDGSWPATEEAVKERAILLYNQVRERKTADVNGDGVLSYLEKDTYLIALAMAVPGSFMEEFPYADRNQSGRLDYLEVYGVIRGITLIAYADRRPNAVVEQKLDLEFYHMALDAQCWILENSTVEPTSGELDNIWSIVKRVQGAPKCDHNRKLDHGGPNTQPKRCKESSDPSLRFKELNTNIKTIRARLTQEQNALEAAKLLVMLNKLEDILHKLENS